MTSNLLVLVGLCSIVCAYSVVLEVQESVVTTVASEVDAAMCFETTKELDDVDAMRRRTNKETTQQHNTTTSPTNRLTVLPCRTDRGFYSHGIESLTL
jgi:hypothetical protein